jgi:glycine cleavage system transcriptional repressor
MDWYMLTLVGEERPGIVAGVTKILHDLGYDLGEVAMMRLGGNFSFMMMIHHPQERDGQDVVAKISEHCHLHINLEKMKGGLLRRVQKNMRVSITGSDRPGIVAEVTRLLTDQGVVIIDMQSDACGSAQSPIPVMHIEGVCHAVCSDIQAALAAFDRDGIEVKAEKINILMD